jgi:uncharacterized membrane protein
MAEGARFVEIDLARGIAILMMVLYHTVFDLEFFSIAPVTATTGFWRVFAYATASLFLLIVGISLVVSHARAAARLSGFSMAKKFLGRGAGIFGLGLVVTMATYLYLPQGCILFGILHLIGISVMLAPLFFRFGKYAVIIGIGVILAGWFAVGSIAQAIPWNSIGPVLSLFVLPLGIHSPSFWSVDYTPLFPWFGVVLVGMGLGDILYGGGVRHFPAPRVPEGIALPLAFLGRHSLVIYLVHQPVIILLLGAVTGTNVL